MYSLLYIATCARLVITALGNPTPDPSQLTLTIDTYSGKGLQDPECMGWLCEPTPPPCWKYPDGPWVTRLHFFFRLNLLTFHLQVSVNEGVLLSLIL